MKYIFLFNKIVVSLCNEWSKIRTPFIFCVYINEVVSVYFSFIYFGEWNTLPHSFDDIIHYYIINLIIIKKFKLL